MNPPYSNLLNFGKLSDISEPQFPNLSNEENSNPFQFVKLNCNNIC